MRTFLLLLSLSPLACGGATPTDAAPPAPTGAEQTKSGHVIQLFRPAYAGRKTKESLQKKRKQTRLTTSAGVLDGKETESTTVAEVVHTVREVNDAGRATVSEYAIERLSLRDESGERELLPAGTVLIVRRAAKEENGSLQAGDTPLDEATTELVASLFSLELSKTSDDDTYGTNDEIAVGASWNLTAERLRESARRAELPLVFGGLDGRMRLVGEGEVRGHACLEIEGGFRAEIDDVTDAPEHFPNRSGHLEARVWGQFPKDRRLPKLESRENVAISIELSGVVRGAPVEIHNIIEMEQTESVRLME